MPEHRTENAMKRKNLILVLGTVLLVSSAIYAYMEYDRGLATTGSMPVQEVVTATRLLADFQADEAVATSRYVGATEQVVQVSGTIRSIEPMGNSITNVVLETGDDLAGVVCEFLNKDLPATWHNGAVVEVNGVCTGLLMDVVLVRCIATP